MEMIEKGKKVEDRNFSLAGVPEYQLDYINDILEADEDKKQKGVKLCLMKKKIMRKE